MKNLNLNYEGFESYLVKKESWHGDGVHYVFRFENGYGASVIKIYCSYGYDKDLWELAVLSQFDRDGNGSCELDYDTPITADVEGYLTDKDVRKLLGRIKGL